MILVKRCLLKARSFKILAYLSYQNDNTVHFRLTNYLGPTPYLGPTSYLGQVSYLGPIYYYLGPTSYLDPTSYLRPISYLRPKLASRNPKITPILGFLKNCQLFLVFFDD